MKTNYLAIGLIFGAGIGISLGVVTDNLAIGLSIGIGAGLSMGTALAFALKREERKCELNKA